MCLSDLGPILLGPDAGLICVLFGHCLVIFTPLRCGSDVRAWFGFVVARIITAMASITAAAAVGEARLEQ